MSDAISTAHKCSRRIARRNTPNLPSPALPDGAPGGTQGQVAKEIRGKGMSFGYRENENMGCIPLLIKIMYLLQTVNSTF